MRHGFALTHSIIRSFYLFLKYFVCKAYAYKKMCEGETIVAVTSPESSWCVDIVSFTF